MKLAVFTLFLVFAINSTAKMVDRVLAIVNENIVTASDLQKFKQKLKTGGMVDERFVMNHSREDLLADDKKCLEVLINKSIVAVEIKRQGLAVPIEKVEQEVQKIAQRNNLSVPNLEKALITQGMNMKEYRKFLRETLETQSLLEREVMSKIKVSEEEIATYFSRNKKLGKNKIFEYTIAQIYFDPSKGGKEAAGQRAEMVLDRLNKGESFEKLANSITEEVSPSSGGLLGTFKSGEFSAVFENAVKSLEVGKNSSVISSSSGFHVLKLVNRKLIVDPAYEKERKQVIAILQQEEFKKLFNDWLEVRRQELFVRIN